MAFAFGDGTVVANHDTAPAAHAFCLVNVYNALLVARHRAGKTRFHAICMFAMPARKRKSVTFVKMELDTDMRTRILTVRLPDPL